MFFFFNLCLLPEKFTRLKYSPEQRLVQELGAWVNLYTLHKISRPKLHFELGHCCVVIPPFPRKSIRNYLPCLQNKIEVGISFSRRHVNVVVAPMSSFQNCFLRQMRHCPAFKPCHRRTDVKHRKKSVSLFSLLLLPIAVHRWLLLQGRSGIRSIIEVVGFNIRQCWLKWFKKVGKEGDK